MSKMDRSYARVIVEFLETTKELNEVTGLSRDAIGLAKALPPIFDAVNLATGTMLLDPDQAKRIAERASREADTGFQHLFQQATISLWSAYEIAIDAFAVEWLLDAGGSVIDTPRAKKLHVQIPITDALDWWERSEKRDFAREVIDAIKRDVNLSSGGNPAGFNKLLNAIGINFGFPDHSTIRVLWSYRNLFVHRGRKADRRFLAQYPGNDVSLDDEVTVDSDKYIRFHHAVVDHIAMIGDEAERVLAELVRVGEVDNPVDYLVGPLGQLVMPRIQGREDDEG
jgi:hypothetical protein